MHEMIYTSAPKTLEAAGLGVVAMTSGIPRAVEAAMRRLSRFDFFSLPEEKRTPKAFKILSHVIIKEGNVDWHICSRTQPAGLDYTNRPNFLSHHIAFTDDELPRGYSVFDVFAVNGMFVDDWNSEPQTITSRQLLLKGTPNQFATAWQSVEAGTNGCQQLAEWYKSRKKAFLLDDSPIRIYQLFKAASHTLSGVNANQIAFTTALGADTQGIAFDWIGIIRGSKFAATVLSSAPEKVVDTQTKVVAVELSTHTLTPESEKDRDKKTVEQTGGGFDDSFFDTYVKPEPKANPRRTSGSQLPNRPESDIPPPPPPRKEKPTGFLVALSVLSLLFIAALGFGTYAASQWKTTSASLEKAVQQKADLDQEKLTLESEKSKAIEVGKTLRSDIDRQMAVSKDLEKERDDLRKERDDLRKERDELRKEREKQKQEDQSTIDSQRNGNASEPTQPGAGPMPQSKTPTVAPESDSKDDLIAKELVACIDTKQFMEQKVARFPLGASYVKLKSVSLITPERKILNVPLNEASSAFRLRANNQLLEVVFRPDSTNSGTTQEASPMLSTMTLSLKEADEDASILALPILTPLRIELVQPGAEGQSSTVLYVQFQQNKAAIGYINAKDIQKRNKEETESLWHEFITNNNGKPVPADALKILTTEQIQFIPVSIRIPQIWPQKEDCIEHFQNDSSIVISARREGGGTEIGKLEIAKSMFIELQLFKTKSDNIASFRWHLLGSPYRPNLDAFDKEARLIGRLERRAVENNTPFPLLYFGDQADFSRTVFLKPSVISKETPFSEGAKK